MNKYLGLVLVGAMTAFGAGCSDDGGGGTGGTGGGTGGTGGGGPNCVSGDLCAQAGGGGEITMPGEICGDTTMSSDCSYLLSQNTGSTFVTSGVLTIAEGVTVFGEPEAALIITRSAPAKAC